MTDFILLFLASLLGTISLIVTVLKWMFEDKTYKKYKFILAISISSVLSLLMTIVVEIEAHWNPEIETGGIGPLLLFILVISWFFIFVLLAALVGVPSKREDGFSKFPVVLVPSVLVSIVDVVIIWISISSPWFPRVL